jgi:hypothetical protein
MRIIGVDNRLVDHAKFIQAGLELRKLIFAQAAGILEIIRQRGNIKGA